MQRRDLIKLAATSACAAMAFPVRAQSSARIVLGQSAAFTGPAAQLGIQMHAGAKLFFDRLNASGGVNGRTIEIRTLDDGYEPDRCKDNTEKFLASSDVLALFGYVGTPTSLAAFPRITQEGIPFFAPFTGAEALRQPLHRNVFHVRASYFDETELIVKNLTSLGLDKVSVFRQDDAYGQAGLDGVVRALKSRNLAPHSIGTVKRNTVDVQAAVQAIVPTRPHAIVQISSYKSCAAFVRAARAAGFAGTFYNVSFVGTQALADELGADGRGVSVSQVMPFPYSGNTSIALEYLDTLKKAGSDLRPNYSSMEGYIAAKVFAEGVRRAGSTITRDTLIKGLESLTDLNLGGFNVRLGASDHVASHFVELSMLTGDGKVRR